MINRDLQYDFPILSQQSLCYLDSANTALTPEPVLAAMDEYYRDYNANIHRGIYPISEKATAKHEAARAKVQQFLGASSSEEIVFTRNATEAINLVVNTWGRQNLKKNDGVLLSVMEHHSNIVPWQILQKEIGFTIHFVNIDNEGVIDQEQYQDILKKENIKMVGIIHQSNTLGSINPVKDMVKIAHDSGALTLVDGAQSVVHMSVDVQDIDSDFFVFTGHKLYGPTGIGVLYGKKQHLQDMPPFMGGGEMIRTVTKDESSWNDLPYKFEAGTPNIAGAIGLRAAIDYINEIGMDAIVKHEQELTTVLLEKLSDIEGLTIYGSHSPDNRGATVSFSLEGIHPHDIASILGEEGICVRARNHCAQPLMEYLGVHATTRASLGLYNTTEDIDRLVEGLRQVQKIFSLSA